MTIAALTGAGNVTSAESNSDDTLTANKPANLVDNDALWAVAYFRNAGASLTAPGGWELAKSDNGNSTFGCWVKPVATAAGEPANYTFSTSGAGSSRCVLLIGRITGADLSNLTDASGAASIYSGTTSLVHPSVSAVAAGCLLLAISSCNLSATPAPTFTADGAMTQVAQEDTGTGSSSRVQVSQQVLGSSGATGTRTATMSPAASNSAGFLITITPAAPAATSTPPPGLRPQLRNLLIR